jgi:hypothetical protein
LMRPLAFSCCAVLVVMVFRPGLFLSLLILTACGMASCFQLAANAAFVSAAPADQRSQAFGLAQGGMNLGQGTAMVFAGVAAQYIAPAAVIAAAGALGALGAVAITLSNSKS